MEEEDGVGKIGRRKANRGIKKLILINGWKKKDCLRSDPIKTEKCHFGLVLIFIISFPEVKHLLFRNLSTHMFLGKGQTTSPTDPPQV